MLCEYCQRILALLIVSSRFWHYNLQHDILRVEPLLERLVALASWHHHTRIVNRLGQIVTIDSLQARSYTLCVHYC